MKLKWIAVAIWILSVAVGLHFLWSYENNAAMMLKAASKVPTSHAALLDRSLPTVVLFAHPHCPCSRASVVQLERVLGTFSEKFKVQIYFYQPKTQNMEWVKSDLWDRASQLPSTQSFADLEGTLAREFKATTSGEVFVYSPDGLMLFHGGLTPSRGHEGDSVGTRSLEEIAHTGHSEVREAAVFGCTLFQDSKQTLGGS